MLQTSGLPDDALGATVLEDLSIAHEELRVAEDEIRTQQEELQTLLESHAARKHQRERLLALLPAPVVTTDGVGVILALNPAASELLAIRPDRAVRKPLQVFVDADDRPSLRRLLNQAAHQGQEFQHTVTLHSREGQRHRVQIAATVSPDEWNRVTEVTWLLVAHRAHAGVPPTPPRVALAQALVDLTHLPLRGEDTAELVRLASKVCERGLGPGMSVRITLGSPSDPEAVASSDQTAHLEDGGRRYVARLQGTDAGAACAVPMLAGGALTGTFHVCSEPGRPIDDGVVRAANLLATAVAAILREADVKAELESMSSNLRTALESRSTIDQAKGIIMATRHCDADQAFAYLSKLSSVSNVKLRTVAARIVEMTATEEAPTTSTVRGASGSSTQTPRSAEDR
ncbi:MAG TPA: ANTAR domain-containing protein [Nocardioidaceae bacterium]